MTRRFPLDQTDAFADLAGIDLGNADLDGVLARLADLAGRAIPDAAGVSVTVSRDNRLRTAASTGELTRSLDHHQYEAGRGPCLEAATSGDTVVINDMRKEKRWPEFVVCALDAGCHSSMSIGLPGSASAPGSLNVYATESQAFDHYAVVVGQAIAGHAAVALANALLAAAQAALDGHLRRAMPNRI